MDTSREPQRSGARLFWVVLVLSTAWRIVAAAKLDLCYDEGYYHLWSLFPRLCYVDHPPFIAWAMFVSNLVFGNSVWTVRIWPVVTGTVFVLLGRALARAMFDERAANRAGFFLALIPAFLGNGLLMTPDTFFALWWAVSLYFVWNALESPASVSPWWLLAGLSAGLGCLSKYNMVLFFLGLGLLWILAPSHRKKIFVGGFICGVISLAIFSPVIIWNLQNHWMSFAFQLGHGFSSKPSSVIKHVSNYAGALLLVATPLLGLLALWSSVRGLRSKELRVQFSAVFCVVVAGFFGVSSLKAHVEANWAMLAFFSGAILAAHDWPGYPQRLRHATVALLVACTGAIALYALLPAQMPLGFNGHSYDVPRIKEFSGGRELAASVQTVREEQNLDFVLVPSHQILGRLSFYAPSLRPLLCPSYTGRIRFPWVNREQWMGRRGLIVSLSDHDPQMYLNFRKVEVLGTIPIPYKKYRETLIYLYVGEDYSPEPLFDLTGMTQPPTP